MSHNSRYRRKRGRKRERRLALVQKLVLKDVITVGAEGLSTLEEDITKKAEALQEREEEKPNSDEIETAEEKEAIDKEGYLEEIDDERYLYDPAEADEDLSLTFARAEPVDKQWRSKCIEEMSRELEDRRILECIISYTDNDGFLVHPELDDRLDDIRPLLKDTSAEELEKVLFLSEDEESLMIKNQYIPSMQEIDLLWKALTCEELAKLYLRNITRVLANIDNYDIDERDPFSEFLDKIDALAEKMDMGYTEYMLRKCIEEIDEPESRSNVSKILYWLGDAVAFLKSESRRRSQSPEAEDFEEYGDTYEGKFTKTQSVLSDIIYGLAGDSGKPFLKKETLPIVRFSDTATQEHFLRKLEEVAELHDDNFPGDRFRDFCNSIKEELCGRQGKCLIEELRSLREAGEDIKLLTRLLDPFFPEENGDSPSDPSSRIPALKTGFSEEDNALFKELLDVRGFRGLKLETVAAELRMLGTFFSPGYAHLISQNRHRLDQLMVFIEYAYRSYGVYSPLAEKAIIAEIAQNGKAEEVKVRDLLERLRENYLVGFADYRQFILTMTKRRLLDISQTGITQEQLTTIVERPDIYRELIKAGSKTEIEEIYRTKFLGSERQFTQEVSGIKQHIQAAQTRAELIKKLRQSSKDYMSMKARAIIESTAFETDEHWDEFCKAANSSAARLREFYGAEFEPRVVTTQLQFVNAVQSIQRFIDLVASMRSGAKTTVTQPSVLLAFDGPDSEFDPVGSIDVKAYNRRRSSGRGKLILDAVQRYNRALTELGEILKEQQPGFLQARNRDEAIDSIKPFYKRSPEASIPDMEEVAQRLFKTDSGAGEQDLSSGDASDSRTDCTSFLRCMFHHVVQTPTGLYRIGLFFDRDLDLRHALRKIIDEERQNYPKTRRVYSDKDIAKKMGKLLGVNIREKRSLERGRKKVAELRKKLGIPNSREREGIYNASE